jgi:N-formylglutamate deformylase
VGVFPEAWCFRPQRPERPGRYGERNVSSTIQPTDLFWTRELGDGPLIAVALHDGHAVRDELAPLLALDEAARLREEDPHTGAWTDIAATRIIARRSRFELDLNRPREKAVYRTPEDAWGLKVWREAIPEEIIARSLAAYDAFYESAREVLSSIEKRFGSFVVFDLHTYNHRRGGPDAPPDDAMLNPQINVGTGTMNRLRWAALVERFMDDLRAYPFPGGRLDVRENVRFRGGQFVRWVHETFPDSGCGLAIEVKKFFMDEWTGRPEPALVDAVRDALRSTVAGVLEAISRS